MVTDLIAYYPMDQFEVERGTDGILENIVNHTHNIVISRENIYSDKSMVGSGVCFDKDVTLLRNVDWNPTFISFWLKHSVDQRSVILSNVQL